MDQSKMGRNGNRTFSLASRKTVLAGTLLEHAWQRMPRVDQITPGNAYGSGIGCGSGIESSWGTGHRPVIHVVHAVIHRMSAGLRIWPRHSSSVWCSSITGMWLAQRTQPRHPHGSDVHMVQASDVLVHGIPPRHYTRCRRQICIMHPGMPA